jgi:hypothetical protein
LRHFVDSRSMVRMSGDLSHQIDAIMRSAYTIKALEPIEWLWTAHTISSGVEALELSACHESDAPSARDESKAAFHSDCFLIYKMLAGFVIENLCKAYVSLRLPPEVCNGVMRTGRLPALLKTHDLLKLLGDVSFAFSEEDKAMIIQLSAAVMWRARYPVPTCAGGLSGYASTGDPRVVRDLMDRVRAHVLHRIREAADLLEARHKWLHSEATRPTFASQLRGDAT